VKLVPALVVIAVGLAACGTSSSATHELGGFVTVSHGIGAFSTLDASGCNTPVA